MSNDDERSKVIRALLANREVEPRKRLAEVMVEVLTLRWGPCGGNTRCLSCKGPMERSSTLFQHTFGGSVRCLQCGKRMSFMQYLGQSIFSIQPLPQGALPFYDKEPDAAEPEIYEQPPGGNGPTKKEDE